MNSPQEIRPGEDMDEARDPPPKNEPTSVLDDLETAWNIIANVNGGNWDGQTMEWKHAAYTLRDKYLARIAKPHRTELDIKIVGDAPAGRQGILYFPPGRTRVGGKDVENDQLANDLLVAIQRGDSIFLPSEVNEHGKRTWEFIPLS